jgi:hypothetical protein
MEENLEMTIMNIIRCMSKHGAGLPLQLTIDYVHELSDGWFTVEIEEGDWEWE